MFQNWAELGTSMAYAPYRCIQQTHIGYLSHVRSAELSLVHDGSQTMREAAWQVAANRSRGWRQRVQVSIFRYATRSLRVHEEDEAAGESTIWFRLRTSLRHNEYPADLQP